jgi:glycosyltransferase involved in cell wall biosynthesis
MDSCLEALERKGNLDMAPSLYNPRRAAERVAHYTPCPGDARFADRFADWNVDVVPYFRDVAARRRPLAYFGALGRIRSDMKRRRISLVRGRLPYTGSLLGCLAARTLGVPSVVSLGGDNRLGQELGGEYYFGSRLLSHSVESAVLRLCDSLMVPNQFTKDYVARLIGQRRAQAKTVVIPWRVELAGVEPEQAGSVRTRLGLDPARPLVLVVGALNRYKLSHVMFEVATRAVAAAAPRPQFVFCGDGPLRAPGEARFAGARDALFVGWQPMPAVRALLRLATVVLVPMSGFVLLEAAAEGRAVIASTLEWHRELVRDGVNGRLVDAEAVEQWCARLAELLASEASRERMGGALRAAFDAGYDPDRIAQAEVAHCHALLERGASRRS